VVEDRALVDAVSAPRAGDNQDLHLSNEAGQYRELSGRQVDLFVNGGPTLLVVIGAVCREEVGVAQSVFEFCCEVHVVVFRWYGSQKCVTRFLVACC